MGGRLERFVRVEYDIKQKHEKILPAISVELVKTGNIVALKHLLAKNITPTFKDGTTLLHLAAAYNQPGILTYLLEKSVVCVNSEDNSCETALTSSLLFPDTFECADILIKHGVNMNLKNKWLRTPLLKCVIDQNEAGALFLLEKGANPNTEDCMGCTPLNQCAFYHLNKTLHRLLEKSADINYSNRGGHTSLYYACKSLNKPAVQILIKRGAEISIDLMQSIFNSFENAKTPEKFGKMCSILHLLITAMGKIMIIEHVIVRNFLESSFPVTGMIKAVIDPRQLSWDRQGLMEGYLPENSTILDDIPALQTLTNLCRAYVRSCLIVNGGNVVSNITNLEIPPGLRSLILLKDIK